MTEKEVAKLMEVALEVERLGAGEGDYPPWLKPADLEKWSLLIGSFDVFYHELGIAYEGCRTEMPMESEVLESLLRLLTCYTDDSFKNWSSENLITNFEIFVAGSVMSFLYSLTHGRMGRK